MEKLKMTANVLFSGIGCQERGFLESGVIDLDVLAVSEIDRDALISYAAMHKGLTREMAGDGSLFPETGKMVRELAEKNIGYDFKKGKAYDWERLAKRDAPRLKMDWLASQLARNLGDISRIGTLPEADLWTVSFPCTDISCAGRMEGFAEGSGTRSSLLWEEMRLLEDAAGKGTQPRYLIFENVRNLAGEKFRKDFGAFLGAMSGLGYNHYWKVLNARECGVPQNRERVFVTCIRRDIDTGAFTFPGPVAGALKLEDILLPGMGHPIPRDTARRDLIAAALEEGGAVRAADAPGEARAGRAGGKKRHACTGLTPEKAFRLMGLSAGDAEKCRAAGIADASLFRQAGNGIAVGCVRLVAEHLYKAVHDPAYACTDERGGD